TLAVVFLGAQTMFLANRWREIATVCHATLAFISALQITFIATFFNQVLPSTVGGTAREFGCLRERAPVGQTRLIRFWLIGSSGSLCWLSSLSRACHIRSPSLTIRSRVPFCWSLDLARLLVLR